MFCCCPYSYDSDESNEDNEEDVAKEKDYYNIKDMASVREVSAPTLEKIVNASFIIQISNLSKKTNNWTKEISKNGVTKEDRKMLYDATDSLVGVTRDLENLNQIIKHKLIVHLDKLQMLRAVTSRRVWTRAEIKVLYHKPLLDLVFRASNVHRNHFKPKHHIYCAVLS